MDARSKSGHDGASQRAMPPLDHARDAARCSGAEAPTCRAARCRSPRPQQLRLRWRPAGCAAPICTSVDGELTEPKLPLVLGHEIVGRVEALGAEVEGFRLGDRVGVPWLGFTGGTCAYCRTGRENLCDHARFTGYQIDGGYADAHGRRCALLLSPAGRL